MTSDPIRIAIVAPVAALRLGLRAMLAEDVCVEIVAEGLSLAGLEQPLPAADVLLMTAEAAEPQQLSRFIDANRATALLLLVNHDTHAASFFPRLHGNFVWGVIPLESSAAEIRAAVHALDQGLLVGNPALLRQAFSQEEVENDAETLAVPLTARESAVLQLLAQGLANKQIAARLGISEHTVKFHISSIYAKLGVNNRAEVVRVGISAGLVTL